MQAQEQITGAGLWGGRLIVFGSLASTNQWVLDNVSDCSHGDVVLARAQTEGRGRFGRTWHSVPGRALTLSVVLVPVSQREPIAPAVCQATALAVRSTLSRYGVGAALKWPNDVVVDGRKAAGILAETEPDSGAVALGIGINVNMTGSDFRGLDLLQPATSIALETGKEHDIRDVCSTLITDLETALDSGRFDPGGIPAQWEKCDFLKGRQLEIAAADGTACGRYAGLNSEGHLLLVDEAGVTRTFLSGDVSVVS